MANILGKLKNAFYGSEYDEYGYEDGEPEGNDDDEVDETPVVKPSSSRLNNVTSFDQYTSERYQRRNTSTNTTSKFVTASIKMEVVISSPRSIEEAGSVCLDLRDKKATVVNLENVEYETAQRISDFLSGACYALEGEVQLISDKIFIVCPANVNISGEFREELSRASGIKFPAGMFR